MLSRTKITLLVLTIIVLFGAYLRLADLSTVPSGLYVDEASTGYNAWSILLTGKDEYGKDFPLAFRFLGSYTPPLYTYLTTLVIWLNGLSVESVRLVSAISGILMIGVIFFFAKSLNLLKNNWTVFLITSFFAINPWSIYYSRIGYEIHLAFLFYSLGIMFLWLGLRRSYFLILGMAFLSISTNTYHAERLLAPLTLIAFLLIFRKLIFKKVNRRHLLIGFIIYGLGLVLQLLIFLTPANTTRGLGLLYQLPPLDFIREFLSQYLSYFSPRNLFFQQDADLQRSLPELSVFYPWMVVPYLIGVFMVVKSWSEQNIKWIAILALLCPIPAALTGDPFSTQRALPLLLPILLIIGLGIDKILSWRFNKIIILGIILISLTSLLYLYRSYAILLPNERAKIWGYGFKELAQEINKRPGDKFIIDTDRIKPAYIELAFYLQYSPEKLQKVVDPSIKNNYYENTNWNSFYNFGNVETRAINFEEDIYREQILVGDELAISQKQAEEHFLKKEFEINSPNFETIFIGFKTNPSLKCKNSTSSKCYNLK